MKNKTFFFDYRTTIKRIRKDIEVVGYNSPYDSRQTSQAVDDIKFAILEDKIIDIKELPEGVPTTVNFRCQFIENKDKSYNQIFSCPKLRVTTQ